jgi:hypothetical protein
MSAHRMLCARCCPSRVRSSAACSCRPGAGVSSRECVRGAVAFTEKFKSSQAGTTRRARCELYPGTGTPGAPRAGRGHSGQRGRVVTPPLHYRTGLGRPACASLATTSLRTNVGDGVRRPGHTRRPRRRLTHTHTPPARLLIHAGRCSSSRHSHQSCGAERISIGYRCERGVRRRRTATAAHQRAS